ncbi:MAG: serine/threonine protein phosphatase [Verrucomicrobiaceae bacterium]|nr:serine/threonine protein phosphatase [Verrucomicrobiaceae bacterium]
MRTLVIGDIHGCSTALDRLLQELAPQREDTLVTLGDYVDRGPDSKGVIQRLIALDSRTQLVPLIGNHELLMLDSRSGIFDYRNWYMVGGANTLASYTDVTGPEWSAVPDAHWHFLEKRCQRYFETETHLFTHATIESAYPLADQKDTWLFWRRFDEAHAHFSGKTLICGHTAQKSGLPAMKPGCICIDTWAFGEGWLTGMDVAREEFIQANQRGELRKLSFEDVAEMRRKL